MAKCYRPVDRDQRFLMPPDMREWLPGSDPVLLVMEIVEQHLDTSPFHRLRRIGGAGRAGYDPDMLLTLLVWGWMQQVRSSRRLERLCWRDVSFRVICAGDVPDHVTIARFRAEFADAVEALFTEVLVLCHRLGLGRVELVAADGTKIAAPASQDANRSEEGLRRAQQAEAEREAARRAAREAARQHADTDACEDAMFGGGRGDEMSDDPGPGSARSARIAEALADLQAEREASERAEAAKQAARRDREAAADAPLPGRPPAGSEVVLAEEALSRIRGEVEQRQQRWLATGKGRDPAPGGVDQHNRVRRARNRLERARLRSAKRDAREAARICPAGRMRNITDPQSRLLSVRGGWVQGYNAQAAATVDGIILATSVSNNGADAPTFIPLMNAASKAAQQMGAGPIGLLLADAGYLSVDNLTEPGPDRLIAVGKRRSLERAVAGADTPAAGKSKRAPEIEAMQARLKTAEAMAAYRRRGPTIETIFGNSKHNWNFTRFTGVGLQRAQTDWAFHGIVHNLSKIINRLAAEPGLARQR